MSKTPKLKDFERVMVYLMAVEENSTDQYEQMSRMAMVCDWSIERTARAFAAAASADGIKFVESVESETWPK